jgi:hypothetical protein
MAIEALEGLTDQELFDQANADDDAPAEEVAAPVVEDEPSEAPEAPVAEVSETPVAAAEKPAVDDNAPQVPSWRVREVNDEKRALADKVAALEAERLQWQRQQQAPRAEPVPEAKVEEPDPLLDPKGYKDFVLNQTREIILSERREASLQTAHKVYKEEFTEAYAAAQKAVDPALRALMQQSRDPGETLIQWHREQKTRAEVGNDLTAFRQREQERLLSDPTFLAKAIEKARSAAQPSTQSGRQPSPVSLPPSLTRATKASADGSADDNDVSDEGLWRHANA